MHRDQELNQDVKIGMIILFLINIIPIINDIFRCCIHGDFIASIMSKSGSMIIGDIIYLCAGILSLILLFFIDYKKYKYLAYCFSLRQLVILYVFCSRGHSGWYEWLWYVVCFILIAYSALFPIYVHTNRSKKIIIVLTVIFTWYFGWWRGSIIYLIYTVSSFLALPIMFLMLYTDRKEKTQIDSSQKFYFEHRSVALAIFLSFITLGIYFIYWFVRIVKQVKEFHGDYSSCTDEVWLNLLVPFYGLYWLYTRNRQMYLDAYQRGEMMKDSSGTCLVFAILGMPLISYGIMQNNMNRYTEMQKINIQNVPTPQISVPSQVNVTKQPHINNNPEPVKKETNVKDKLIELQDMLNAGLITQEDYDIKKQKILKDM